MSTPHITQHDDEPDVPVVWAVFAEFVYVVDLFVIALMIAMAVIGGLTPFESPVMSTVTGVSIAIVTLHWLWYRRFGVGISKAPSHRRDRERRGF